MRQYAAPAAWKNASLPERGSAFSRSSARTASPLLGYWRAASKGDALRAELRLKALPRAGKLAFFQAASAAY